MVRKISGKFKPPNYTYLNIDDEEKASAKKDIADTLGSTFMRNSSSRNYSNKFQTIKKEQEKRKLDFKSSNNENYNNPFNFSELIEAIEKSHDTATGPDHIQYQMLKHLPKRSLQTLLNIFNIWETGEYTETWRLATIVPIPKPGKDHAEPTNFIDQ